MLYHTLPNERGMNSRRLATASRKYTYFIHTRTASQLPCTLLITCAVRYVGFSVHAIWIGDNRHRHINMVVHICVTLSMITPDLFCFGEVLNCISIFRFFLDCNTKVCSPSIHALCHLFETYHTSKDNTIDNVSCDLCM